MKINDKIINYLSGNMSEDEKIIFEKLITDDPELKSEFEKYKRNLAYLTSLANLETDTNYFNSILPRVHEKLENRKPLWSFRKKIAFAFPIIIIITFLIYKQSIFYDYQDVPNINNLIASWNDSVKTDLLTVVIDNDIAILNDTTLTPNANQVLTEEISKVLLDNTSNLSSDVFDYLEGSDVTTDITDEEAKTIYDYLINKKII